MTEAISQSRFFYDDNLTAKDGLFREVVRSLYDDPPLVRGPNSKTPWLERPKEDGVFLIDLATVPVNEFGTAEREAALAKNISQTVSLASGLRPHGIVMVKQNVSDLLERPIRAARLPLLHAILIPFPGSGQQKRFRERFRERFADALARLDSGE